ncbi:MAG: hypothetical protein MZV49_11480 [Rhodopseudomonas palustris]|nr:hypothetical protein [Rhodopseudomonas palustris]
MCRIWKFISPPKRERFYILPKENALQKVTGTDIREITGKQDFVKVAAVNLVYVSDFSKAGNGTDEIKTMTAATHCGFMGQKCLSVLCIRRIDISFQSLD